MQSVALGFVAQVRPTLQLLSPQLFAFFFLRLPFAPVQCGEIKRKTPHGRPKRRPAARPVHPQAKVIIAATRRGA